MSVCHANARHEGGFNIEDRASLLKGGDDGAVIVEGKSGASLLIRLVSGLDSDRVMPAKGPRLSSDQIGVLRAWIDQSATWENGFTFKRAPPAPLHLRAVALPAAAHGQSANPVDLLLIRYFAANHISSSEPAANVADDRTFIRRASLDIIGLLPEPGEVASFAADTSADEHCEAESIIFLAKEDYAEHWMTFSGTTRAAQCLSRHRLHRRRADANLELAFSSIVRQQAVRRVCPRIDRPQARRRRIHSRHRVARRGQRQPGSGNAGCAEHFPGVHGHQFEMCLVPRQRINDWTLNDSYGFAGIFSDSPLEIHRCDKPMGRFAPMKFLYPELGTIDPKAPRDQRLTQLARAITNHADGRFARTIVNRLWSRMFGRALVEPVDDMDQPAWDSDLLEWLASDLVSHNFDLKHTLQVICTSRAYQMRSVGAAAPSESGFVFRGPVVQRMTAEQFVDGVCTVTDVWPKAAEFEPALPKPEQLGQKKSRAKKSAAKSQQPVKILADEKQPAPKKPRAKPQEHIRAVQMNDDELTRALGRTDREQVITHRDNLGTTLQALELTNGTTLDDLVRQGA